MNKNILIVTTFNNHFFFFSRMVTVLNSLGYSVVFLTNKYSIYKEARKLGLTICKIEKASKRTKADLNKVFEVINGDLTLSRARKLYHTVYKTAESLHKEYNFEYLFAWSGVRLIESSAADFAKRNSIKTLFFELGNFPGKIFVDPIGTNAKSLLAANKDILNKFSADISSYENWKDDYINESLKKHSVPQSSSVASIDVKKNILDLIGFKLLNFAQNESILRFDKFKNKIFRRFWKFNYDEVDFKNIDYVFYPMQVSDDAQLILNSEVDNTAALIEISKYVKENGLQFLVKPHPAEVNFSYVKKIEKLKNELGFRFVSSNTIELIIHAKKVFTINSTVGLQALILDKEIQCFGKALYKDFNKNQLSAYVTEYLMDMDFWGNREITTHSINALFQRADLK